MKERETPLLQVTRLIFWFVALNAFAGAAILILWPERTESLFFWPVSPPINAALFGALYLAGAAAVSWVTWRGRWESARFLVPVLVTAGVLISAVTLIHLDKFTAGIRLNYWLLVYVGAPLLALLVYYAQERRNANWQVAVPIRPATQYLAVVTGLLVLAVAVFIFLAPELVAANWPWPTSPLMLHIFAAWFGAFGAGLLWFLVEKDWQRMRLLPTLMLAAAGLDLAMLLVHRTAVTVFDLTFWLYAGHLLAFGSVGILLHWLQRASVLRRLRLA